MGLAGNCAHRSSKLVVLCGWCCEGLVTLFVEPPPPSLLLLFMLCRRAVQEVVVVAGGRAC